MQRHPEVFGHQVTALAGLQGVEHAQDIDAGALQGVVLSGRRDDDVAVGQFRYLRRPVNHLFQPLHVVAPLGADAEQRDEGRHEALAFDGVDFVVYDDRLLVHGQARHLFYFIPCRPFVDHPHHDACAVDGGVCTFNADLLHAVVRGPDAGRVDESECYSVDVLRVLNRVARRSVNVADDGAVLVQQSVQQCRFSDVRLADDGHGDAFLQCLTGLERTDHLHQSVVDFTCQRGQFAAVGEFQVLVVREVEFQFQQRGQLQQLLAQSRQLRAVAAPQLRHGNLVTGPAARGDEVGHRLRLREVHLAVQEGALRELARTGHAASLLAEQLQHLI